MCRDALVFHKLYYVGLKPEANWWGVWKSNLRQSSRPIRRASLVISLYIYIYIYITYHWRDKQVALNRSCPRHSLPFFSPHRLTSQNSRSVVVESPRKQGLWNFLCSITISRKMPLINRSGLHCRRVIKSLWVKKLCHNCINFSLGNWFLLRLW
jgi:hypothetical protein